MDVSTEHRRTVAPPLRVGVWIAVLAALAGAVVVAGCGDSDKRDSVRDGSPQSSHETVLAEVEIEGGNHTIAVLQPGVDRLTGKTKAKIQNVGDELAGRPFTVVPWKSTPSYRVRVTRPGYIYALKGSDDDRRKSGLTWEHRRGAISGSFLDGAYRAEVSADQLIEIAGYELSLVAGRILVK